MKQGKYTFKKTIVLILTICLTLGLFAGAALAAENNNGNTQPRPNQGWVKTDVNGTTKWQYFRNGQPVMGWLELDGKTYFLGDGVSYDTYMVAGRTLLLGQTVYLFDENGVLQTTPGWHSVKLGKNQNGQIVYGKYYLEYGSPVEGWKEIGNDWYYFEPTNHDCRMTKGNKLIPDKKNNPIYYYFDQEGRMATGLYKDLNGHWCFARENGHRIFDAWGKIEDVWRYFDENGYMVTGWKKIKDLWFFFGTDGAMYTGWQIVNNSWYYFGDDGVMATGWKQLDGYWYYFGKSGIMRTGWQQLNGKWNYFTDSGKMATGWKNINNKWYYFNPNSGKMTTGWKEIGGRWYYFADTGRMFTEWHKLDGSWYYFGTGGKMQVGWKKLDGNWYYFNANGIMVTGKQTIGGKTYKFNGKGILQ